MKPFTLLVCLAAICAAQQGKPEFDVASVKAVDVSTLGDAVQMNLGSVQNGRVTFGNAMLKDCIRLAYGIPSDIQVIAPEWMKSMQYLYNIDARTDPKATPDEVQSMTRSLLEDRFKLKAHREQREMSYLALVVGKNGPKIAAVSEVPVDFKRRNFAGNFDTILPMPTLAYLLSRFETERPILDMTGLTGSYRIQLKWAWAPRGAQTPDGPSLFSALEEQLGLKLESRKGPIDVLVVDSAEKTPTEN